MQSQEERQEVATQFLSMVEDHFQKTKEATGIELNAIIPVGPKNFDKILGAMDLIRKMAKEKNFTVELLKQEEAFKEYGHAYCFCVRKIS